LYRQDERYQKRKNPTLTDIEIQDKIIKESIILQSGENKGYVTLDAAVFNSSAKDMARRDMLLSEVKEKYSASREETVSGTVISVWFLQPGISDADYAQRKTRAYSIIKLYYDAVSNNTMSLEEAAKKIRTNKEIAVLDPAYETNTSFTFLDKPATDQIVTDADFDQQLKQLPLHTLSELSTGQLVLDNDTLVDAVYLFGMVTDRKEIQPVDFDYWIASEWAKYAITEL